MERLTKRIDDNHVCFAVCEKECPDGIYADNPACMCTAGVAALKRLMEYEDAEEQGKLLILPCNPGDILYETQFINRKWEIFVFNVNYFEVMKSRGKTRVEIHFEGTEGYALCDENGNLDEGWYFSEQEARGALEGMKI